MVETDQPAMASFDWQTFFTAVETLRLEYRSAEPGGRMYRLYDVLLNSRSAFEGGGRWAKESKHSLELFQKILRLSDFDDLLEEEPRNKMGFTESQRRMFKELTEAGAFR